jgi:hypothetical protein
MNGTNDKDYYLGSSPHFQSIIEDKKANSDLREEARATLDILKRLEKPLPPNIEVRGPHVIEASWLEATSKGNFPVRYQLYEGLY